MSQTITGPPEIVTVEELVEQLGAVPLNRIRFPLLFVLCAGLLLANVSCVQRAELARNGQALMRIVLADNATERQKELADELADYLKKITGASFEVMQGDGSRGIVLGTPEQFRVPAQWRNKLRISGHEGKEAYGVLTSSRRVLLLGATDLGLDRGITRLLEEMGCRWFFPHPAWHVTPRRLNLSVELAEANRPALLSRVIWYGYGYWDRKVRGDFVEWQRRNWMGESLKIRCGHAWQAVVAKYKKTFEEHPEYLALQVTRNKETGEIQKEERKGTKFCVSNPGAIEVCKRYALEYFEDRPEEDMVSMEPSDGLGHCECPECARMGSVPERVFYLVNEVAKAVGEKYPDKYVGVYAYSNHSEPPSFRMEPNVYVQITAGFTRGRYTFLELIGEWAKHVQQLGVYEYLNVWAWTRDMPGAARGANTKYLLERIPYYIAHKATTMSNESGSNFGPNGLGYLVASRLMWNPKADVAAVQADFFEKAFGPAAAPMRAYYERFDGGNRPLLSDHLLALACKDVAEASSLAAVRPDVIRRLDDVKLYLYYVSIMRDLGAGPDKEKKLKLVFDMLNFAYRNRHRYIVNSPAVRGRYRTYYMRNLKEPKDWDWRKTKGKPAWARGSEYTHEEVEAIFQKMQGRYHEQAFETRSFSDNLVPGGFPKAPKTPRGTFRYQRQKEFVLLSLENEPLEFKLQTGIIAWYRDRRPTAWKVTNAAGAEIAGGELPLDGEWHPVKVPVPGPGTYHLNVNDYGAGWAIDYTPGKPYSWKLPREGAIVPLGITYGLYFYVPKGAEQVAYYVLGNNHTVLDSEGKEIAKVPREPGNIVTIPVPKGKDGTVWCLKSLAPSRLWFFNYPNVVAMGAEDLLIPAELSIEVAPRALSPTLTH